LASIRSARSISESAPAWSPRSSISSASRHAAAVGVLGLRAHLGILGAQRAVQELQPRAIDRREILAGRDLDQRLELGEQRGAIGARGLARAALEAAQPDRRAVAEPGELLIDRAVGDRAVAGGLAGGQQRGRADRRAALIARAVDDGLGVGGAAVGDHCGGDLLDQVEIGRQLRRGAQHRLERRGGLRRDPRRVAVRVGGAGELEVGAHAIPRGELGRVDRREQRHPRRGELAGRELRATEQDPRRGPGRALDRLRGVLARGLNVALRQRDVGQPQRGDDVVGLGQRANEGTLGRRGEAECPVPITQLEQRALRTHRSILLDPAQRCRPEPSSKNAVILAGYAQVPR
jgi:hypothetical protein